MNIQVIQNEDFEELYDLWRLAGLGLTDRKSEKKEFLSILALNHNTCFKLIHSDRIIASILGTWNGKRAWIYRLAVLPKYQRKNCGSRLLSKCLIMLKLKGAKKVILGVDFTNLKTLPFYEQNGFSVMNDSLLLQNILT